MKGDEFDDRLFQFSSNHDSINGFELTGKSMDPASFLPTDLRSVSENPSLSTISDGDFPYKSGDFSYACLKFISDMLMEEDLEDKPCMVQDCLALQAAEKSFYDVIGEKYPPSADQFASFLDQDIDSPCDNFAPTSSVNSCKSNNVTNNSTLLISDQGESSLHGSPFSATDLTEAIWKSSPYHFQEVGNNGEGSLSSQSGGRKTHKRSEHDYAEEKRSNKQSLMSTEELEQLEILDNSFLRKVANHEPLPCPLYDESRNKASKKFQQHNEQTQTGTRIKRLQANNNDMVDLWNLLNQCAQSVASGDQRNAGKLLQQIRLHASPFGDGNQRLAHYFADGLEARLAGTGLEYCTTKNSTAADILKAYQLQVSIIPFRKMTNTLANRTIAKIAEKATTLHIIDFGISYGFQWPCFIKRISTRSGGPPKIRMTGIDLPQPGFRPAERVEETGRRLKRVAERLNVEFEYNAIAQKWESVRYEDLKINKNEVIAVNCMFRLRNLPDDTIVLNSSRDAILKLIKQINPDIFMHGVVNGSYNAPFFATRFREALFHFSAFFDIFDANATHEDQERLLYEREIIGRDAVNVIACEGRERVERPETYKQWQMRNSRMGFRQIPLYPDVVKMVKSIKADYHKDFVVDEDGQWLLLGWKGRIIHAISAWKPVQD